MVATVVLALGVQHALETNSPLVWQKQDAAKTVFGVIRSNIVKIEKIIFAALPL